MSNIVEVEVAGRSYRIRSDEGSADLREVARLVNERIEAIQTAAPDAPTERVAILAALNMGDELLRERATRATEAGAVEAAVEAVRGRLSELGRQVEGGGAKPD